MKEGYVALIDILGFSHGIMSVHLERYIETYIESVSTALGEKRDADDKELEYIVFSDTIVLNTLDDTVESLYALSKACSRIFYSLITNALPLRGAITYGPFARESIHGTDKNIVLAGPPIIESYNLEKKQEWLGIMLASSAIEHCQHFLIGHVGWPQNGQHCGQSPDLGDYIAKCESIPMKSNTNGPIDSIEGFAVFPTKADLTAQQSIFDISAEIGKLKLRVNDPADQKKYGAAKKWLDEIFAKSTSLPFDEQPENLTKMTV
jgi:hypothetical protein